MNKIDPTDATQRPLWVLDIRYQEWQYKRDGKGKPTLQYGPAEDDELGVIAPTLRDAKAVVDTFYRQFGDKRLVHVRMRAVLFPGEDGHPYPRKARKEGAQ